MHSRFPSLAGRHALVLVCTLLTAIPAPAADAPGVFSSVAGGGQSFHVGGGAFGIQELTLTPVVSYHPQPLEAADNHALRLQSSSIAAERMFYFDAGYAPGGEHMGAGVALGDAFLSFLNGGSEKVVDDLAPALGLGAPYLRGLYPIEYRYTGVGAAHALGGAGSAYVGALRMESEGRVDHQVFYGGIAGRYLSTEYLSVDQLGTEIGSALGLGLHLGPASLGYQQLRSDDGEKLHRLRLSGSAGRYGDLALQYETGQSPFTAREEDRFLLSFQAVWGPRGIFSQNGSGTTGDSESERAAAKHARAGWVTAAAIGGAALAAALVAGGSGSDDEGNAGKGGSGFARQHDAAYDVLNNINPTSVRENREYGGWVFREGNGTYGYTVPVRGSPDGVDPGTPNSVPGGTIASAGYHTHASFDPRYDNENFSPQDIAFAIINRVDEYLATPSGSFKYYQYATGGISTLGRVSN
jgi:hypothetical protein